MMRQTGELKSVWASIGGVQAHARVSINPVPRALTPVVLVHGLSVSSRYMVPTARQLAPYRRVYAPDLPGFGKSQHPPQILDIPALADALAGWMDFFGVGRAVLLGNSIGCQIIADFALRCPGRVERAVLVGPTVDRSGRTLPEQARRLLVNVAREPISSILTQARDYWACGLKRTVATFRYALADRIEEKLPHMRAPTLVVRGADDPISPQRWCEELVRRLPDGRLLVIAGAPHAANYDAPEQLARAVLSFLNQGDADGTAHSQLRLAAWREIPDHVYK
jgi:2-hydroxy-6-oxonona-2,4-dienedioate hydrolase